jgi:hypothetical protein
LALELLFLLLEAQQLSAELAQCLLKLGSRQVRLRRRRECARGWSNADDNLRKANGQPIAVRELCGNCRLAIEEHGADAELAEPDTAGKAGKQADECGQFGAAQAQIAAGNRADDERLAERVRRRPSSRWPDLQASVEERIGRCRRSGSLRP